MHLLASHVCVFTAPRDTTVGQMRSPITMTITMMLIRGSHATDPLHICALTCVHALFLMMPFRDVQEHPSQRALPQGTRLHVLRAKLEANQWRRDTCRTPTLPDQLQRLLAASTHAYSQLYYFYSFYALCGVVHAVAIKFMNLSYRIRRSCCPITIETDCSACNHFQMYCAWNHVIRT